MYLHSLSDIWIIMPILMITLQIHIIWLTCFLAANICLLYLKYLVSRLLLKIKFLGCIFLSTLNIYKTFNLKDLRTKKFLRSHSVGYNSVCIYTLRYVTTLQNRSYNVLFMIITEKQTSYIKKCQDTYELIQKMLQRLKSNTMVLCCAHAR